MSAGGRVRGRSGVGGCEHWLIRLASDDDDGDDEERGGVTTPYLRGRPAADADEPTSLLGGHHWIRDHRVGAYLFAAVSAP